MFKRWMVGFLVLLMFLPIQASAAQGAELVVNGGFEQGDGMDGWALTAWTFGDVYTSYAIVQEGIDNSWCALIENYEPNDARFEQSITVKKDTLYRLTAMVKYQGEESCNLSFLDTDVSSVKIHDTQGTWSLIEIYGRTGKKQTSATIALRVGYYGELATGKAWFDDVSFQEVEEVPEDLQVVSLQTKAPNATKPELQAPDIAGLSAIVVSALFVLLGCALYSFAARSGKVQKRPASIALAAILLAGLVLRLVIAYRVPGYEVDLGCFEGWGAHFLSVGPTNFYFTGIFCDYPPAYLPVLGLQSAISQLFGLASGSAMAGLVLKLPSILCDLATCYLLYRIAVASISSHKWGLVVAALYALCPAVLADSSAWGQIDSVLTLLIALSLYAMVNGKLLKASIWFCIGVLIKPQALMFGPILLLAFLQEIHIDRKQGLRLLAKCFGICVAICIVVFLPFNGLRNPLWIFQKYGETMSSYPAATVNAMNLFALFDANWLDQNAMLGIFSYKTWGTIFMILSIAYAYVLYGFTVLRGKGDKRALLLCACILIAGVFSFGVRMHERYLFPTLALLLIAFLLYGDRRLLAVFFGFSAGQAINILVVLAHDHVLATDRFLMILGAVLHIAATLYLFYISFCICIKQQVVAPNATFAPFRPSQQQVVSVQQPSLLHRSGRSTRMSHVDVWLMIGITLAYAILSFVNLGDRVAPATTFRASAPDEQIVFDLQKEVDITRFYYYGELPSGDLQVQFSTDGVEYGLPSMIEYKDNIMFIWKIVDVKEQARYAKVTFQTAGLTFFEFGFTGDDGIPYPAAIAQHTGGREGLRGDPSLLLDEQSMVPVRPTYLNGMYFDEIYHARTGYEQVHGIPWYETTHPPLGKVIISWCIQLLGMNPFAWRLGGTLAGILMLPGMYLLGKLLFKRTEIATAATLLLALDCMHFTQTRIATIDSFAVLFIIWSFYFMFLYASTSWNHEKFWRTLPPLFASGLFMGLGCASKWIGIYSALGLAVVFFYTMGKRFVEMRQAKKGLLSEPKDAYLQKVVSIYARNTSVTLLLCVLFFIAIPAAIYYASYYQYLSIPNMGNTWRGVLSYQTHMFTYHSNTFDPHPYSSTWYQWPIIWKPMAFFFDYRMKEGWSSSISTFGNPAVWWAGLVAIVWQVLRLLRGDSRKDPRLLLVTIGFAAQFLPWILITRTTYIYHYFASVPFLILSICFFLEELLAKGKTKWIIAYLVLAFALFVLFYPVASGLEIPIDFAKLTNWLPKWRLFWG